jgi:hypothetical protein
MSIVCPKCGSEAIGQLQLKPALVAINDQERPDILGKLKVAIPHKVKLNYWCASCAFGWYASYRAQNVAANKLGCLAVDQRGVEVDRSAAKEAYRVSQVHKTKGS